jgi:transcriptional regulator with XRE-family HTH domain
MAKAMNYREILARNVKALKDRDPALNSNAKIAKHCSTPTRRVSKGAIGYLLNPKSGVNPKVDTIIAVAQVFKVPPWLLLSPNFDSSVKAEAELPDPAIIELARKIADLPQQKRELLMDIFAEAVPDHEIEAAGYSKHAMHQRKAHYKVEKQPRQLRMKLKRD